MTRGEPLPWLKPGFFLGSLVPAAYLLARAATGTLGADPIASVLNQLGLVALIFLLAALACRPARALFGWTWPMRLRRQLGLFAFFYGSAHFLTYVAIDQTFDFKAIVEDILKRNFILVGFLALVTLAPLALTSTNAWVRRLGYRRWQRLHSLIYLAGALAVLHFIWRVKADISQPLAYGVVLASLLLVRVLLAVRRRTQERGTQASLPRANRS